MKFLTLLISSLVMIVWRLDTSAATGAVDVEGCDVLGARVQVLWKGCSNGSSAQTVLGGDGEVVTFVMAMVESCVPPVWHKAN